MTWSKVESNVRLGPNVHGSADGEEIIAVEKVALGDERVQAEIAKLKLPEGTIVISDPWIYGIFFGRSCSRHILTYYRIRWRERRFVHGQ